MIDALVSWSMVSSGGSLCGAYRGKSEHEIHESFGAIGAAIDPKAL
jgi:hypothetical protein